MNRTGESRKHCVVLVCEDDNIVRSSIADMLEEDGMIVIQEEIAKKAADHIRKREDINLLITDIRLSGDLHGLALAHWVMENRPDIRILAVSGLPQGLIGSSQPERYAFLPSPFSRHNLIEKVKALLPIEKCARSVFFT